jgi:hypothetical protein
MRASRWLWGALLVLSSLSRADESAPWDPMKMYCWFDNSPPVTGRFECLSLEQASRFLDQNSAAFERYRKIQEGSAPLPADSPAVYRMSMSKLTVVAIHVDLRRGRYEEAYQLWARERAYVIRSGKAALGSGIDAASLVVGEGFNLMPVDRLLDGWTGVVRAHGDEILKLLEPGLAARLQSSDSGRELALGSRKHERLMALLAMKVRLLRDDVPDARVAEYIRNAAPGPYDVGAAMTWNPAMETLRFEGSPAWEEVRLRG